jgi:lipid-A-disaccharide synthase
VFDIEQIRNLKCPTILLLAGESSGDAWGADLASELRKKWPDLSLMGTGGPLMERQGVELIERIEKLSVMGLSSVLKRIPFLMVLRRKIRHMLAREQFDLVIAIDFAGFNMSIIRLAHRRKIKVLYYVAPKVWAWGPNRSKALAKNTNHIAVILPFEKEFLKNRGIEASFVGHPLLDQELLPPMPKIEFCQKWNLDPQRPILALFPGSRKQEINRHLDLFVKTGYRIKELYPQIQLVIAKAPSVASASIHTEGIKVVDDGRGLLAHSRVALLKSGTVTLEACLSGTPFVTAYKTDPLTFFVGKRVVKVKSISIPNLVAGREQVPEMLQGEATPENLVMELIPFLKTENHEYQDMLNYFTLVRSKLGSPGVARRVADIAGSLITEI